MGEIKKVGIMGGTFDPIHIGHLILAENAYEKYHLDSVLMMPNGDPPHKTEHIITPSRHRIRMVQLAIEDNGHFELSTAETEGGGLKYTCVTLEALKSKNPNTEYYFILGADSLFSIEKWREPEKIFRLCTVLAATRYHLEDRKIENQIEYLSRKYCARIARLDTPNIDVSSRMIRTLVTEKKTIKYYVPKDVEQYIYKNNLYRNI
jgi:nicotinate-nucleotide adenylyltransferase